MVSKTLKRTPTKPPKPSPKHARRKKLSPLKALASAPSAVANSIDRSIRSCRRRLFKIFARIAFLGTPPKARKHGFRRLNSILPENTDHPPLPLSAGINSLPPPPNPHKKTIFLDLDETLVHSKTDPPPEKYDFAVHPTISGIPITFYVLKRPGVDEFLKTLSESFEVIVFTAGLREYASLVVDRLDPKGEMVSHRLYRDSCKVMEGKFVKELSGLGRELGQLAIVDDNPNSYFLNPENAVAVTPFVDDLEDQELRRVAEFFQVAVSFDDMRVAIACHFADNGDKKAQD